MDTASGVFLSPKMRPYLIFGSKMGFLKKKKHVFKAPRSRKYEHNALFESLTASKVKIQDSKHDLLSNW